MPTKNQVVARALLDGAAGAAAPEGADMVLDALSAAGYDVSRPSPPAKTVRESIARLGALEAWEWSDLGDRKGGVAITTSGVEHIVAACEQTPEQMRELARRLLNVAHEIEERS